MSLLIKAWYGSEIKASIYKDLDLSKLDSSKINNTVNSIFKNNHWNPNFLEKAKKRAIKSVLKSEIEKLKLTSLKNLIKKCQNIQIMPGNFECKSKELQAEHPYFKPYEINYLLRNPNLPALKKPQAILKDASQQANRFFEKLNTLLSTELKIPVKQIEQEIYRSCFPHTNAPLTAAQIKTALKKERDSDARTAAYSQLLTYARLFRITKSLSKDQGKLTVQALEGNVTAKIYEKITDTTWEKIIEMSCLSKYLDQNTNPLGLKEKLCTTWNTKFDSFKKEIDWVERLQHSLFSILDKLPDTSLEKISTALTTHSFAALTQEEKTALLHICAKLRSLSFDSIKIIPFSKLPKTQHTDLYIQIINNLLKADTNKNKSTNPFFPIYTEAVSSAYAKLQETDLSEQLTELKNSDISETEKFQKLDNIRVNLKDHLNHWKSNPEWKEKISNTLDLPSMKSFAGELNRTSKITFQYLNKDQYIVEDPNLTTEAALPPAFGLTEPVPSLVAILAHLNQMAQGDESLLLSLQFLSAQTLFNMINVCAADLVKDHLRISNLEDFHTFTIFPRIDERICKQISENHFEYETKFSVKSFDSKHLVESPLQLSYTVSLIKRDSEWKIEVGQPNLKTQKSSDNLSSSSSDDERSGDSKLSDSTT